jgi:aryl-alcohol dehydrogenase-like predicted oxidoreductase
VRTRRLGNSDLHITPIGFGAWAIGGGNWKFGWGNQDDENSVRVVHEVLDHGVNWIDTAPVYGHGHSEEIVGRALAESPASRRPMVFTKCGHPWDENGDLHYSLKPADLRKECEDSLRRLRVDAIDLYQFHWPQPEEELEDGWRTMQDLKAEGKVRWVGVCNCSVDQMKKLMAVGPVTSHQMHYSLLRPNAERGDLPFCEENGVGVLAYSPMGSGLLTGTIDRAFIDALPETDWRKNGHPHFREPLLSRNLELVELLKGIGARHGVIAGAVAVAWVLRHRGVTAAIVGGREPGQFHEPVAAAEWRLTPAEEKEIADFVAAHPAKAEEWGD